MPTRRTKPHMEKSLKKISEPLLATSYRNAVIEICKFRYVGVPRKTHPKFRARQAQLDELDIAYDTYAYTVIKTWWPWCRGKGMQTVSIGIFCGKKAWDRFLEMMDSTVRLTTASDDNWNAALHNEMTAARIYISTNLRKQAVSLKYLRHHLKCTNPREDIMTEALRLLNMAFDTNAQSYDDIIYDLAKRYNASIVRYETIQTKDVSVPAETEHPTQV